jgi:CHRD domain
MKKAFVLTLAVAVGALTGLAWTDAGDTAVAKTTKLNAAMNPRQVVTVRNKPWKAPAAVANAKGTLTGTVDTRSRKLSWRITYTGIGNPAVVIADIHIGKPGKFGAILVRLCSSCESGQRGVKTLRAAQVQTLTTGDTWVTVITEKYPNGVIRGQIRVRASSQP